MTNSTSSAELQALEEVFASMADDELLQRWRTGSLTEVAVQAVRAELKRRGISEPEVAPVESPKSASPIDPNDYVTVLRSFDNNDLATLRGLLKNDGIPAMTDHPTGPVNRFYVMPADGIGLLVPKQRLDDANQLISIYRQGGFELQDTDDVGTVEGDGKS
jgi:hypothetical protein